MDIYQFVRLAKKYAEMGSSVQDQLIDALHGNVKYCNPNAVQMHIELLERLQKAGIEDCEEVLEEMREFVSENSEG